MKVTSERVVRQIRRVIAAETDNFVELVRLAGLDPAEDFKNAQLTGIDFSQCDLSNFDFSNTHFVKCDFRMARIKRARFDKSQFEMSDLSEAADWSPPEENNEPRRGWWQRTFGDDHQRHDEVLTAENKSAATATSPQREALKLEGRIVKGIVTAIETDLAVIDVGLKSEGRVALREFAMPGQIANLKIGDEVEVYVDRIASVDGEVTLSRNRARREAVWDKLEAEFKQASCVDGVIFGRVKGGFTVDLGGAVAFLPGSQVDIRPVKDVTPLMDVSQSFQIVKMDRKRGNIVVSRRAIIEGALTKKRAALMPYIHERRDGDAYRLPTLDMLKAPPASAHARVDKTALERNARLLESVLDNFNVHGNVVDVRQGPVVTIYEFEPAAGIKASRVIQLADDIARNMSALSARVATIPGRSVMGIELPNKLRESFVLHELIRSQTFADQNAQLPIILGKNIAGDPVIADLAAMPHLLVAGTTGSGKSVGLNAMIVSLLYKLSPDQCRMIMIDPKMLELSVYDDIPHLLSPVVTEPTKAIRALKWAVEQMEDRHRMLASISVRGLAGYNDKVRAAKVKGEKLYRRVQAGYDADIGQPIYDEEFLDYEPLPQIVVIVDELADLMMTAGKEVEFLIQRLGQKARAAGIHLIMATQKPSVDVITGVIKANLPTRISFAVTSKIESRTILGEQGAEQLLGKGDMLYMPGGKQIARVHGPFVSDEEVRKIADHWRSQGTPDYIQAVTEEPEEGIWEMEGAPTGEDSGEDQLYRKAVQIVAESRKASTSYLQRQLRIGYNSAARLIERMENDGKVSRRDHVGRREVLTSADDGQVGHQLPI